MISPNAEAHRRMRLKRKNNKLCSECGINPPEYMYESCLDCILATRLRNGDSSEIKRCSNCQRLLQSRHINKSCKECRQKNNDIHKKIKSSRKKSGLCIQCGIRVPWTDRQHKNAIKRVRCKECLDYQHSIRIKRRDKDRTYSKDYRDNIKNLVYIGYGDKCNCCNDRNREFFTIDHINDDGAIHRRELGNISSVEQYKWIIDNSYPNILQILCANCHLSKTRMGVCYHMRSK